MYLRQCIIPTGTNSLLIYYSDTYMLLCKLPIKQLETVCSLGYNSDVFFVKIVRTKHLSDLEDKQHRSMNPNSLYLTSEYGNIELTVKRR